MKSVLVKQTLVGNKTQTRRTKGLELVNQNPNEWKFDKAFLHPLKLKNNRDWINFKFIKSDGEKSFLQCPYGQKGDIIWVKETFQVSEGIYRFDECDGFKPVIGWKPSIHMPKAVCRLFLEIVDVRPERLQSINYLDAIEEGIEQDERGDFKNYFKIGQFLYDPISSFQSLISLINGSDCWPNNPWVWRIEFKIISKPETWPA